MVVVVRCDVWGVLNWYIVCIQSLMGVGDSCCWTGLDEFISGFTL